MEVASGVITEPALAALSADTTALVSTDTFPVVTVSGMPILSSDASIDGLLGSATATPIIENVHMLRDGSILSSTGGTQSFLIATSADGTGLILLDASQLLLAQPATTPATIYDGANIFRLTSQDISNSVGTSTTETLPGSTTTTTLFVPNDCSSVVPGSEQIPLESVPVDTSGKDDEIQPPIKKGPHKCDTCHKEFPKWGQLLRHLKLHFEDKPHKCHLCDASFNLESNLLLHKAVHCTSNPTCPECGKKFSRIASLKAHVMLHEKEENLICTECGDEFSTKFKLDRHVAEHRDELMSEKYYPCKQCPKVFSKVNLIREHMKMHYKIKASLSHRTYKRNIDRSAFGHKCFTCGKQFQKHSQLIRHTRIHTGERPFKCDTCNKAFNQKGALQIHMIKHSGERPHRCEFCPATFSQRGNLRVHIQRVHNLEDESIQPLYRCEECSCVFRKLGSLNAHMSRMHTGEFNLSQGESQNENGGEQEATQQVHDVLSQIIEVTKSFSDDPDETKQQIRKIAEESKMNADILQQALENSGLASSKDSEKVKADKIRKAMLSKAMLMTLADTATGTFKKHLIRRVGGVRWYQCVYCFKEFKKPSDLVRHIRIHTHEKPFKCDQCFRAFAVKSTLTAHLRTHTGVKEFKCEICSKMFSTQGTLKVHFFLHSNIKPFLCNICDKSFRTSGHRKSHMLTHHKDGGAKRVKRSSKAQKIDTNVPDIPLQEPILITDAGFIQPLSKNSNLYNQYINEEQSDERPYRCDVCNRAFKKSSHLKQHHRSHTGEKPFSCHQCNRAFVSNGVLKAHVKTHSGIKPYRCEICSSKFTTNGSLRRHMCIHSNERPYMCPYCQKTFKTSMNCKKHMKTHRHELAQGQLLSETVTVVSEVPGQEVELGEDGETVTHKDSESIAGHIITNLDEITAVDNHGNDEISLVHQAFSEHEAVAQENLQHSLAHQVFDNQAHLHSDLEQATLVQQAPEFEQPQPNFFSATLSQLTSPNFSHNHFTLQADPIDVGVLSGSFVTSSTATLITEPLVTTSMASILQSQDICEPPDTTAVTISSDMPTTVDSSELAPQEKTVKSASKKGNPRRSFRCSECDRYFKKASHLKQHLKSHSGEKPYKCIKCNYTCISVNLLRGHIRTHSDVQDFKCSNCNGIFSTKSSLKRHMTIHDSHKSFQCPHCPETFKTKAPYKLHLISKHKDEEPMRLESEEPSRPEGEVENVPTIASTPDGKRSRNSVLQLSALEAAELAKHNPNETNSVSEQVLIASAAEKDRISEIKDKNAVLESLPKYANQCSDCPKSFKKPSDLVRHVRIHTGEKPYSCKICNKSFTVKSTLDSHVKTHTGEKNFSCHVCYSFFATKGSLKVHMRLHTGAKPFKCPHCELRFRTSGHRKSHITSHFKGGSLRRRRRSKADGDERAGTSGEATSADMVPTVTVSSDILNSLNSGGVGDAAPAHAIQTVDGIQLQLTPDILGQSIQITSLDPSLLNKPLQIDASLLQQIQRHININITVSPDLLTEQGVSTVQTDPTITVPITSVSAFQESLNIDSSASSAVANTNSIALNPNVIIQPLTVPLNSEPQTLTSDSHIRHTDEVGGTIFTITDASQTSELNGIGVSHHVENEENLLRTDAFSNSLNQSNGSVGISAEESTVTVHSANNIVDSAEMQTIHLLNLPTIENIDGKSSDPNYVCSLLNQDLSKLNDSNNCKENLLTDNSFKFSRKSQSLAHECNLCEKAFAKKSQLERHMRIHTGERPFVCNVCFKAFNQKNALQIHMTKHTGEKRYKCDACYMAFTQKGNLKEHMKRVHSHS